MKILKISCLLLSLLLPLGLVSCGASSVGLGDSSDSLASVYVKSTDIPKARRAVAQVFAEEGFTDAGSAHGTLFFRKEGGRAAYLAWGGWGGDKVMINPQVGVYRAGDGIRLDCDLYISTVSEHFGENDAFRPWGAGRSAYRRVLRRIKKRIERGE